MVYLRVLSLLALQLAVESQDLFESDSDGRRRQNLFKKDKAKGNFDLSTPIHPDKVQAIKDLKQVLHTLTVEETKERFRQIHAVHGRAAPPGRQQKIDHFVVLYMENRGFDHTFGCMNLTDSAGGPPADGIPPEGHYIPTDPKVPIDKSDPKTFVKAECGTAAYVCKGGPGYDAFNAKFGPGGNAKKYPYSPQDDKNSYAHGGSGVSLHMFNRSQLPVKHAISQHFGVFNKLYTAVPTSSTPNHHFTQSATSCGSTNNNDYQACGGPTLLFPQFTMYDSMHLDNVSFTFYMNSTCGKQIGGAPCHSVGPHKDTSPVFAPDSSLAGIVRYTDHYKSHEAFYEDAAAGNLSSFTWINAKEEACDHPCNDMAKGERAQKDIYEALRAGPAWNKTLFLIAYDDAGGTYDHMVPPFEGVPDDESPCQAPCQSFDFRRLGLRSTAMLISPWVQAGRVFQEPQAPFDPKAGSGRSPFKTSQFELTSVAATVKHLFNLTSFLTKRDMWAGNFEELLLDTPRTDAPMHLPDAPPPARPWGPVPKPLPPSPGTPPSPSLPDKDDYMNRPGSDGGLANTDEDAEPQHCPHPANSKSGQESICPGVHQASMRQRRLISLYSKLVNTPEADVDSMTYDEAAGHQTSLWHTWMEMGAPAK